MKYDLSAFFAEQKKLDESINKKHAVTYEDTIKERILAFLVELGELCNETRCFKYWSLKGPSPKPVVLEEYIDGLHFIMSIGIYAKFANTDAINVFDFDEKLKLTDCLLDVYNLATDLIADVNRANYYEVLTHFLGLSVRLGFNYEDLKVGYEKKLAINYQRQDNNY